MARRSASRRPQENLHLGIVRGRGFEWALCPMCCADENASARNVISRPGPPGAAGKKPSETLRYSARAFGSLPVRCERHVSAA